MKILPVFFILLIPGMMAFIPVFQDDWEAPKEAKTKKNPVVVNQTTISEGKKTYEKECLSCHGKKGKGDGPKAEELDKAVKDLGSVKTQGQTDGELFWKITEGKKPMPSTKKTLSETQRWQVVLYIRTFVKTIPVVKDTIIKKVEKPTPIKKDSTDKNANPIIPKVDNILLQDQVNALKTRIDSLEKEVKALKEKIDTMKKQNN